MLVPGILCMCGLITITCDIAAAQDKKPNSYCEEDYKQYRTMARECQKSWTKFTEATLALAMSDPEQLVESYDYLLAHVSTFIQNCQSRGRHPDRKRPWKQVQLNFMYEPCGSMSENLFPIVPLRKWEILAPKNFSVNITFTVFYLDDPFRYITGTESCTNNYIILQYYDQSGEMCNTWANKQCSWRAPWSITVPSHHVSISLHSLIVVRSYHLQYIYQIVEKCDRYFHALRSHDVIRVEVYTFYKLSADDLFVDYVMTCRPGYSLTVKIHACIQSDGTTVLVCDGPRPFHCKYIQLNCKAHLINTIMYSSFIRVNRISYQEEDYILVRYTTTELKAIDVDVNKPTHFHISTNNISLYHKAWKIYSKFATDIKFNIKSFVGYTEHNCQFGGFSFYTSWGQQLGRRHGPYCSTDPNIPLTGASELSTLTLPNDTHVLVMHGFMEFFKIDLVVTFSSNIQCSAILNICDMCFRMSALKIAWTNIWDHVSYFNVQCDSPQRRVLRSVYITFKKQHRCLKVQHVAGDQLSCTISLIKPTFSPFSSSQLALELNYIPPITKQYDFENKCTPDKEGTLALADESDNIYYLRQNTTLSHKGQSTVWYLRLHTPCDWVNPYAVTYTVGYEETKKKSACSKYEPIDQDSFYSEPHTVCGTIHAGKPGVSTFLFDRTYYRYNVDIYRVGRCHDNDLVRIIYGLLEKPNNLKDCKDGNLHLEYTSEIYNTLLIDFTGRRLQFEVYTGTMLVQIVKTSNTKCLLTVHYEIAFVGFEYHKKHAECIDKDGWFPRQNQVVQF